MANKVLKTDGTTEILRLIKAALANKQDKITIDSALSATSENPVENGAIYDAIKDLVSADYQNNTLTLTSYDGTVITVDIPEIDDLFKAVSYDTTDHKLTFTRVDDSTEDIDLSELYNIYDVDDTDEIDMTLDSDNKISAEIKTTSIKREKLHAEVTDELDEDRKDIDDLKKALGDINTSTTSLGDIEVLPLVESATDTWQPQGASRTAAADFKDEFAFGYAFTGSQYTVQNKPFNRIKLMIGTPGWVRVGIVRGTGTNQADGVARGIYRGSATYDTEDVYPTSLIKGQDPDNLDTTCDGKKHTALKKWLVVQWVATPGLHEFDIPDEVITSPYEYVFMECRTGISGFAMNRSGAAVTTGDLTIADNYLPNALATPTQMVSTSYFGSGSWAMSQNMLDSSARIKYSSLTNSGIVKSGWDNFWTETTADRACGEDGVSNGWLNIGLYYRGTSSSVTFCPLLENVYSPSTVHNNSAGNINSAVLSYGPRNQDKLVGKEIYALDVWVATAGDMTLFLNTSTDPATNYIKKQWTLRIRAIGPQRIHLPEPIVLQKGEWLGVTGATEAAYHYVGGDVTAVSTSNKFNQGYSDTANFCYGVVNVSNYTSKGDDATGVQTAGIPYDAILGDSMENNSGFIYWSGVKYTGDSRHYDFTSAEFHDNSDSYLNGYLNIGFVTREGKISKIEDLNVSITGDSITTYRGIVSQTTDWGGVTNAAGNNSIFYPDAGAGHTNGVDQTWWGKFIKDNRARLIRNDAWSGSRVSGTDSNTSSTACASQVRTRMLNGTQYPYAPNTTTGLPIPYGNPEVIVCMIGTNDLSGGIAAGAYSNTAPTDISTILGAFQTMIARHKANYPGAKLVYFMIPRGSTTPYPYTNSNGYSISQMADGMEYVAKAMGAYFVPLNYFRLLDIVENASRLVWTPTAGYVHPRESGTHYNGTDRLHPNAIGHALIANGLTRFIAEKF